VVAEPLILWALACHRQVPPDATVRRATPTEAREPHHAARARYLNALYLSSQGHYEQAEASVRVALLFDPGSGWLHLDYGRWLLDLGAWTYAESHLLAARDYGLGALAGEPLVRLYTDSGRPQAALEAAVRWADEPLSAGQAERALALVAVGRVDLALPDALAALQHSPADQAMRRILVMSAHETNRWWTALQALDRAAQSLPDDQAAWRDLALAASEAGHEPLCDRATARWFVLDAEAAVLERSRSVLRRKKVEQAASLHARLLGDEPEVVVVRAGLASLLGRHAEARADLEAALERAPSDRDLRLRLADVSAAAGDGEAALAALGSVVGLSAHALARLEAWALHEAYGVEAALAHLEGHPQGGHPSVLTMRGGLLLEAGRVVDAVDLLKVASARRPEVVSLRVRLAEALLELGDLERAAKEAQVALTAEPGRVDALLLLAGLDLDAGGGSTWAGPLTEAVEAHPGNAWLVAALARAHYQGGDAAEAAIWARAARVLSDDEVLLASLPPILETP